jgi:RHS repeat-associated protein
MALNERLFPHGGVHMNKFLKIISVVTLLLFLRTSMALCADQVYFYYTDPAGTPLVMSDSTGSVVWRADYMPFGEESIGTQTVQNNKMFVGKEKDSESGLYYFGARYMDAGAGRFTAIDPKGPIDVNGKVNTKYLLNPQRLNRYAYAGNNPYAFIDPDGLDWYYSQFSGRVVHIDNQTKAVSDYGVRGYSGKGEALNNHALQNKKDEGSIVEGTYKIGKMGLYTKQNGDQISNTMELTPEGNTNDFIKALGRDGGFLIHGGSWTTWDDSSGCIVMDMSMRNIIDKSDDKTLQVVPSMSEDFFFYHPSTDLRTSTTQ